MSSAMYQSDHRRRLSADHARMIAKEEATLLDTLEIDAGADETDHHDHFLDVLTNMHALYIFCAGFFACGVAYTMYFGIRVMQWPLLRSVFFFAITVSTTGYTDFDASDSARETKWLIAYMWVCVLVCGLGLGVVIAFAHENFESGMANITASTYEEEEAEKASTGGEKEAHASRIVAHARAKMRNLNHRLVMEFAQLALLYVLGVFVIMRCETHWDILQAALWATESLTTIGYGDVIPKSNAGMAFSVAYLLVGAAMFARIIAFISMYPSTAFELGKLVEIMESVGMRRRKKGPLHALGKPAACNDCASDDPRRGITAAAEPGRIHDDVLAEIWTLRDDSKRRLQKTHSSQRLMVKSLRDKGHLPEDLDDAAGDGRLHRPEFILHFLQMIKKVDPNDILDASDFYNSLCEHNPNAAEHGVTLDEARHATDRFNRMAAYESNRPASRGAIPEDAPVPFQDDAAYQAELKEGDV